jgi:N-acetylglucosaminyldiphosphoundecaprenol N-acetyl-beta-D-mannosaminyltransferase
LPLAISERWRRLWACRTRHHFVIVQVENEPTVNEPTVTLRVFGDATFSQAPQAMVYFRDAVERQKSVVVDLSRIRAVDARFFGLFLMLRKQLKGSGFGLRFVGVSQRLERLFALNGLGYLLSSSEKYDVDTDH